MSATQSRKLRRGVVVRLARDDGEIEAAYELAARVFGPNYFDARDAKRLLVTEIEPLAGPADAVVAVAGGAVVGFIRLVSRRVRFGSDVFRVTGITSVAVAPECRGQYIGAALMRTAMGEGRRRGDDLAVLFARRAVDGWYPQFGFLGIGQHVECRFAAEALDAAARRGAPRVIVGFDRAAVGAFASAYDRTHRRLPGHFLRTPDWWRRAGRRLEELKTLQFVTLVGTRRAPVGYAVLEGDGIRELAMRSGSGEGLAAVVAHLQAHGHRSPALKVHPDHPEAAGVFARNHTLTIRRAWDGGHMAAPLHPDAARRLRAHGIATAAPRFPPDPSLWPVWSPLDEF